MTSDANDSKLLDEFADLLNQYWSAVNAGQPDDAEEVSGRMFDFLDDEPDEIGSGPEWELTCEADLRERVYDWTGTEATLLKLVELPDVEATSQCRVRLKLSWICQQLGRHDDALRHAQLGTEAVRAWDGPSFALTIPLEYEAKCHIQLNRIDDAEKCVAEFLSLLDEDPVCHHMRAEAYLLLAECALLRRRFADVDQRLDAAFKLLKPVAKIPSSPGGQGKMSQWLEIVARVRSARGDLAGAIAAWNESLTLYRRIALFPWLEGAGAQVEIARKLLGLARDLERGGSHREARRAINERKTILKQLKLPIGDSGP